MIRRIGVSICKKETGDPMTCLTRDTEHEGVTEFEGVKPVEKD